MVELYGRGILKQISPRRRLKPVSARNKTTVHERPCIKGLSACSSRDERPGNNLHEHQTQKDRGQPRWRLSLPQGPSATRIQEKPQEQPHNDEGHAEMGRQTILADRDHSVLQPGVDHPPANRALKSNQEQNGCQSQRPAPWKFSRD